MTTVLLHIPDELKSKTTQIARKKNMSFNSFVNYWLQVAVMREETIEWMNARLKGKNHNQLIDQFGQFLAKSKPGGRTNTGM